MTNEERELSITYLEEIKEKYIEGEGYERHPVPEYYAIENAIKALEPQPKAWSLDDAREDFMCDVYNTLDFLPTNNEANRIIDSFDRVTSGLKQETKNVLGKIIAEIEKEPYVSKMEVLEILNKYEEESEGKK